MKKSLGFGPFIKKTLINSPKLKVFNCNLLQTYHQQFCLAIMDDANS